MLAVQDQQPIQTLRANRPHEPFRDAVCLRGAKRRANDLDPIASKHLVKTLGELLVPIANQEAERFLAFCQASTSVAGPAASPTARSDSACIPRNAHDDCPAR